MATPPKSRLPKLPATRTEARLPRPIVRTAEGGPRIGLALGGGAAKGIAHIAMLEVFDDLGLKPSIIAGTSIGAIVGANYASGMSGRDMRAFALKLFTNRTELLRRVATRWPGSLTTLWNPFTPAIFSAEALVEILMPETLPLTFEKLGIPFITVATDFYAQEQVLFEHGALIPAIAASSALPALMTPVEHEDRVLIDGGFVNPTPFDILRDRADLTVAIDVTGTDRKRTPGKLPSSFEVTIGGAQITLASIVKEKLKQGGPDVLIRPAVNQFAAMDFMRAQEILEASEPAKEELKRKLSEALERMLRQGAEPQRIEAR
jgi:NTE family protein